MFQTQLTRTYNAYKKEGICLSNPSELKQSLKRRGDAAFASAMSLIGGAGLGTIIGITDSIVTQSNWFGGIVPFVLAASVISAVVPTYFGIRRYIQASSI